MRKADLRQILSPYATLPLARLPTPLHHLPRLSARIGCNVYAKRDDLSGFCLGGNKVRKLEYLLGDAISKKADTLVTKRATNFSRNAAAAGALIGCDVHVFILGSESEQNPASRLLFRLTNAKLHFVAGSLTDLDDRYAQRVADLRASERTVYELHPGGSDEIGTLGYLNAFTEIAYFSTESGVHFSKIFHASGSAATQAGLVLGKSLSKYEVDVIGIAVAQQREEQTAKVLELTRKTALMLGVDFDRSAVLVDDAFIGPGYAQPSEAGLAATSIFANDEGLLLDQVYCAKAAAALLDYAKTSRISSGENILFVHTGGNSDLYY